MGRRLNPPAIPNAEYASHLGSGGFADVFLYSQRMPERDIAVKVIRADASDEQNRAFEAEANLMAKMSAHPAILSVFGAGVSDDGRSYLIMEYCPPPHLGVRARKRTLPVPRVLDIAIRIAGAVETLHRASILHRDIKPSNILITQFGHPVLTDFGIAASTAPGNAQADTGFSVPWAPPEQQSGSGPYGPAMDVYSLAATVHTLLCGHSPFEIPGGDNREISMLNRVLRTPVPKTGRSDVPPELERILAIAMAKDPANRYQSMMDFALALQQVQVDMHQRTTPIDVLGDRVVEELAEDGEDATRARSITTINPLGNTPAQRTLSDEEGTRTVIRRIEPHIEQTGPTQDLRTEATVPYPAPEQDDDAATRAGRITRIGILPQGDMPTAAAAESPHRTLTDSSAAQDMPTSYSPTRFASPADSGGHGDRAVTNEADLPVEEPAEGAGTLNIRRPALILGVLLIMGALGFGIWSVVSTADNDDPAGETSVEAPDELPITVPLDPVTGVRGTVNDDATVTFVWDPVDTKVDYLYRVIDPINTHPVRKSTEASITVPVVEGRTCIEIVLRNEQGQTSDPVIECVDSP